MFTSCQNCQFLLSYNAVEGSYPSHCPHCGTEVPKKTVSAADASMTNVIMKTAPSIPFTQRVRIFFHFLLSKTYLNYLIILILGLLLVLQILVADRYSLAKRPQWRPVVLQVCGIVGCDIPVWHKPSDFSMLERDIRARSEHPGLLYIRAKFQNNALWEQQWPHLQVSLFNADGKELGTRIFSPQEYAQLQENHPLLAPQQITEISFEIKEPSTPTDAFSFDFH